MLKELVASLRLNITPPPEMLNQLLAAVAKGNVYISVLQHLPFAVPSQRHWILKLNVIKTPP